MKDYNKKEFWSDLRSGRFENMVRETAKKKALANSQEAYNIFRPLFLKEPDVEKMNIAFLTAKNKITKIECVASGTLTSAVIFPREIIKKVIKYRAAAIIMSHNHPSGDPQPSNEDFAITKRLMIPLIAMGVTIHEHIIIGSGCYYSMCEEGWLTKYKIEINDII